jgi:hypothetical protein
VGGSFSGTGHFGPFTLTSPAQTSQPYVARLAASGTYQWVQSVTGYGRGIVQGLAIDAAGNTYATGSFDGQLTFGNTTLTSNGDNDVFVAKLSPTGAWLWAASGGGYSPDVGRALAVSATGTVYVTGQVRANASFGTTPALAATTTGFADLFVAALNATTGAWQWSRCAAGTGNPNNYGFGLGLSAAGEVYIAGSFTTPTDFGGTTLTAVNTDIYVAKLSAAGTWQWARKAGGTSTNSCPALAVDAPGNAYITGVYTGPATFGSTVLTGLAKGYVAKLDAAGTWQWARQTTGGTAFGKGIALDATGQQVYACGNFSGTVGLGSASLTAGGPFDVYVAALDAAGTWQWAQQASGADRLVNNNFAAAPSGGLYVGGYAVGNATFGAATLTHPNPPAEQPFVARVGGVVTTAREPLATSAGQLVLWPNPAAATQVVRVRWAAGEQPISLRVHDALGREVYQQAILPGTTPEATFPAPPQPGWYQCHVVGAEGQVGTRALVVQP